MALSIRTNVSSLNAQRNLSANQVGLDSSLSRLSSGFRITRAGDDAAGLGISTKLESQIRSYGQAVRNANDGLSVVQTTEAALNEQSSILTRLRELAMQSGSDGVGDSERGYINREAQALLAEIGRINAVTEYNGTKLLSGTAASLDFQVGIAATANDVISVGVGGAAAAPAVSAAQSVGLTNYVTTLASNGYDESTFGTGARSTSELAAAAATNAAAGIAISDGAHELFFLGWRMAGGGSFPPSPIAPSAARDAAVALVTSVAGGGSGGNPKLAAAFSAFSARIAAGGTTGAAHSDALAASAAVGTADMTTDNAAASATLFIFQAAYSTVSGGVTPGTPVVGAARTAGLAALGAGGGGAAATGIGVTAPAVSLGTKSSALAALAAIDTSLESVASSRATLGATGNRLQSAIANIQAFSESLSAANSRIKDVDVAEETSRMSRSQILLQAGVSVLAQANQAPQMALKLLG